MKDLEMMRRALHCVNHGKTGAADLYDALATRVKELEAAEPEAPTKPTLTDRLLQECTLDNQVGFSRCPSCAERREKKFEAWTAAAEPRELMVILRTLLCMRLRNAADADGFIDDVMTIVRVAFGAGGIAELDLIEENAEKQENPDESS